MNIKGLILLTINLMLFFTARAQEKKVYGITGKLEYIVKPIGKHQFYIKFYSETGAIEQEGVYTDIKHPKPEYNILWDTYRPCGKNKLYHENGVLNIECEFDTLSDYHGVYKAYSQDKIVMQVTHYFHGKKHGQELGYNNGVLLYNDNYNIGIKEGLCYVYYEEGDVDIKEYKNGKLNGTWIQKNKKGVIVDYFTYANDTLNGLHYSLNRYGERSFECYYKNGKLEGKYVSNSLGAIKTCYYSNGVLEGEYKVHDENGELCVKTYYKNGKQEGEVLNYTDGKLALKGFYKEGKKEGVWYEYDYSDKTYWRQRSYENDTLISESPWKVK